MIKNRITIDEEGHIEGIQNIQIKRKNVVKNASIITRSEEDIKELR
jgi:hypothetical protein